MMNDNVYKIQTKIQMNKKYGIIRKLQNIQQNKIAQ